MKKNFFDPFLKEMLNERGKLCVSVILPMYKISPERNQNPLRIKNALEEAKGRLKKIHANNEKEIETKKILIDSLGKVHDKIDFIHTGKGIGIFISENISHIENFPFEVAEKIIIGDSFETRDMLYKEHYLAQYFVLALTMNSVRLFKGKDGMHIEIHDKNFPKEYHDDFIYEKTAFGSSYSYSLKNTEKDKSVIKMIRLKDFYHEVDKTLSEYLTGEIPLIISGVAKCLSSFLEITAHQKAIITQISGNYSDKKKKEFEMKTWKKVLQHQSNAENILIKDLENKYKTKQLVTGMKEVWKTAQEGKGLLLAVEKDFRQQGFERSSDKKIFVDGNGSPLKMHSDAVDDLIELVLEKNGTVTFLKNGALKKMQRVALLTRY